MISEQACLKLLTDLNISFEYLSHKAVYTIEEAERELSGRNEIKNLFIQDDKGKQQYLVIMPGRKQLDLKTLAFDIGEKKVRFVSAAKLEQILQVKPGSVSLFCCLSSSANGVSIVIDQDLFKEAEVGLHPIINTATVFISSTNLRVLLDSFSQTKKIIAL